MISPTKNLNFLHNNLSNNVPGIDNNYQKHQYFEVPMDEEKLAEKKRKKNQKKKRKRKEKKILA